jgi:hypothetical protein
MFVILIITNIFIRGVCFNEMSSNMKSSKLVYSLSECIMLIYFCIQVKADLANYFYSNMLLVYPNKIVSNYPNKISFGMYTIHKIFH